MPKDVYFRITDGVAESTEEQKQSIHDGLLFMDEYSQPPPTLIGVGYDGFGNVVEHRVPLHAEALPTPGETHLVESKSHPGGYIEVSDLRGKPIYGSLSEISGSITWSEPEDD